ncbi:MAG: alpha-mannosidase [bacterium]|nr:alpha-mannosidase [bacterium]
MHKELNSLLEKRCLKFSKRVPDLPIEQTISLDAVYTKSNDFIAFKDRLNCEYKTIKKNEVWGEAWDSAWFHITGIVPAEWRGKTVAIKVDFGGESLIFSNDGEPVYSLTHKTVWEEHYSKKVFELYDSAEGGEKVDLWIESAANGLFGIHLEEDPDVKSPTRHGSYDVRVFDLDLCAYDNEMEQFNFDFQVLYDLMMVLPENTPRRKKILRGLNDALDVYNDDRKNTEAARAVLKVLLDKPADASSLNAVSIGHAHLDTGWLWPVKESIRKTARTFASQMYLLDKYPDYVFGASQAQLYEFAKNHYPNLYERIKKYVKDGSWEIQGGMWVEADCNLISGESMVRQFVYGKNYFKDEFDVDVKNLWLPDVFGYSAATPQILKKSGCDYFLTQKISWSQFNEFPHHTFMWEGIDGSEVLTHFIATNTYNGDMTPKELINAEKRFVESDVLDEFLSVFGIGDGGGGPAVPYIERSIRQQNLEGCPKVKFDQAQNFFDRLENKKDKLEKWSGELYLELHRGTLTTQAKVKKGNRQLENKLRVVEYLYSLGSFNDYPKAELDAIWKLLLINQFHDILPGSSIKKVYDVTLVEYEDCLNRCDKLIEKFADKILQREDGAVVCFNDLSNAYTRPVNIGKEYVGYQIVDENGKTVLSQDESEGKIVVLEMKDQGFTKLYKSDKAQNTEIDSTGNELVLENNLIRYEFSTTGEILSAFDKEVNKEILSKGNEFKLYQDRPADWDAWDVDIYYENQDATKCKAVESKQIVNGVVRKGLSFKSTINNSSIDQKVYLASNSKRLDFETAVQWNEVHKMLRVSFDTHIKTSEAVFDIQYGYVKRNTHRNTSWDVAKFEVAGHKYADLSDNDYGVALMNDCKYGYKVLENTLDLNLLRSTTNPDPDADKNQLHTFTYSLLPHNNSLINSNVIEESSMLNNSPVVFKEKTVKNLEVPCWVEHNNGVSLEVLKKAEKEDHLIVRLVETRGRHSACNLRLKSDGNIIETNLIEWEELEKMGKGNLFSLSFSPFEIKTFKIIL